MVDLQNGYEAVPLAQQFVLRLWKNGLPHDIERFPFSPTVSGDRKGAFASLWRLYERLNAGPVDAAKVGATAALASVQLAVVVCECGRSYTEAQFVELRFVGIQTWDDGSPDMELRNCVCGSTRCLHRDEDGRACDESGALL